MSDLSDQESLLSRWSRRKAEAAVGQVVEEEPAALAVESVDALPEVEPPGDEDMPPLESLTLESDYSGFFSTNVSEALRKKALRKLFSHSAFNVTDGLDDYDEDYTRFTPLGDLITADMKHQWAMDAQRQLEALQASAEAKAQPQPSGAQPMADDGSESVGDRQESLEAEQTLPDQASPSDPPTPAGVNP